MNNRLNDINKRTFVNILGTDGNFSRDGNSDGIPDGWIAYNTAMTGKVIANNEFKFTPTGQWGGVKYHYKAKQGDVIYVCAWMKSTSNRFSVGQGESPWNGMSPSNNNVYE